MRVIDVGGSPDLTWLGLTVGAISTFLVAVVGTIGLVWRRRQDHTDAVQAQESSKQMSESEQDSALIQAREQATKYYNLYTFFRGLFYDVQQALRHLVRKLRDAHPDMNLDQDVVDALALKPEADDTK